MEKIPHTVETRMLAFGVGVLALGSLAIGAEVVAKAPVAKAVYVHENTAMPQLAPEPQKRKLPFPKSHGFKPRFRR